MHGSRRIWIGNTARPVPPEERLHPDLTHTWTVYVRAADPAFITGVTFRLHESFADNVVDTAFPFEVTEQGWGEFSVGIRIHTVRGSVATSHFLRIHGAPGAERVDEIVFRGQGEDHPRTADEEAEYRAIERAVEHVLARLSHA